MSIFGWCTTGAHEGADLEVQTNCKGSYRKVIKERTKRGRKVTEKILLDEMVYCDCPCHQGKPVGNKKKTIKPRRKK